VPALARGLHLLASQTRSSLLLLQALFYPAACEQAYVLQDLGVGN
jgi:hypothetical protein